MRDLQVMLLEPAQIFTTSLSFRNPSNRTKDHSSQCSSQASLCGNPPTLTGRGVGGPTIQSIQSSPQKGKWNPTWNSRGHPPPQFHFEGGGDCAGLLLRPHPDWQQSPGLCFQNSPHLPSKWRQPEKPRRLEIVLAFEAQCK